MILLATVSLSHAAETLRISAVVKPDSPDAKPMTCKSPDGDRRVWVSNKAIITEKDVKSAHPVLWLERAIGVELTEEGAAAMIAATTPMHRGRDRLAILIEGRLHSDPVIQSVPLGASFLIEGLTDYDDRQFANLIHGMMGREPLAAQEEPIPPAAGPEPPQAKLEPYTEEEFKAIRERRERMGIHQLDRLPDQAELDKTLHRGMTADEVIAIFGKPSRHNRKAGRRDFHFEYEIAPERRPDKSAGNMTPEGFKVEFRDDKVVSWGASLWSSAPGS